MRSFKQRCRGCGRTCDNYGAGGRCPNTGYECDGCFDRLVLPNKENEARIRREQFECEGCHKQFAGYTQPYIYSDNAYICKDCVFERKLVSLGRSLGLTAISDLPMFLPEVKTEKLLRRLGIG